MFEKLTKRLLSSKTIEEAIPIFLILLISIPLRLTSAEEILLSSCRIEEQNEILNRNQVCELRDQVEDLLPNLKGFDDDVHRIIPSVVVVKRCGGNLQKNT